jgi:hypothetical protein
VREDAEPRRRTWSRAILVAALVAAVVGTAVGARAWFDTREEIDRTAAAVGDTRNDLTAARTELVSTIADLREQRAALHAGLATLDTREGERDAAEGALATAKNRLAELRAELDAATADLAERESSCRGNGFRPSEAEVMGSAIGTYRLELASAEPVASRRVCVGSAGTNSTSTRVLP